MEHNRPCTTWIIRKPDSRYYFNHVAPSGNIVWTHYDNAMRFRDGPTANAINEYVRGVVVELNPQTINYSKEIII